MTISAAQVKELRERTGAGMMDCKNALTETNGDIELAIENMRKSGLAKAAKKAGRIAAEGVILSKATDNRVVLVEINCETDFVARDASFLAFGEKVVALAFDKNITDVAVLADAILDKDTVEVTRAALVAKIGENISIRRIVEVEGSNLGVYIHSARIGVVTSLVGGTNELAKDLAMHVAASNPQFVKPSDVSTEVVEKEREIQIAIAMESGKPKDIAEKMVAGRMQKFTHEVSLTGQAFVKDPSKSVEQLLKENNADVTNFVRIEVGEGIEKKEQDFAAEVEAQLAAMKK